MSKTNETDNLATGGVSAADIEIAGNLRTVIQRMVKVLRKHTRNEEMLSLTERSTLGLLYQHGQLLPTELAQMEKVTTQSISQVVAHLVEIAYIVKTPAESDKRKAYLSLTPAGRDYIDRHRQEKQEWLARILHEKTTAREKELLSEALTILGKLIED
jgi:DNA-binding MarR family transcriptional regulator